MALFSVKGSENIPSGAIKVSKTEALMSQRALIRDWEKESDVFFLRYSGHIATGMATLSSILIMRFNHKLFRLPNSFGLVVTYLPISLFPAYLVNTSFEKKITNNVLLMNMTCPMCDEVRYIFRHLVASVAYPGFSASVLLSLAARIKKTADVPSVTEEPKKFFQYMYKLTKPSALKIQGFITIQVFVLLFLPFMQSRELNNINEILIKRENDRTNKYDLSSESEIQDLQYKGNQSEELL